MRAAGAWLSTGSLRVLPRRALVAFSCKRRGFCPSCGARRMAESAALLVDEVLPEQPMRQWVLSFPFQLRFLFGVVCGKGRNPTLRLWPAIFSGEIDVFRGIGEVA